MAEVKIIRHASTDPKVAELVQLSPAKVRGEYREIFPEQVADMVSWLAGTQRFPAKNHNNTLDGNTDSVRTLRQGLYQFIEEEFPGGLVQFLEHFPRD